MAMLPIVPSISPHSNARLAPIAWAEVPNASPFAILLLIRINFSKIGPVTNEKMADTTTNKMVNEGIPPIVWEIDMAIGAVTDFGISENIISLFRCSNFVNKITEMTPVNVPGKTAKKIIRKYFFIIAKCLYNGIASDTVAVPKRNEKIPFPSV